MKLINTDGMAFIGPGSEWFWTALSGIVLAITFIAIYRQLRLQRSQGAIEQTDAFEREWNSERFLLHRLNVLVALQNEADPAHLPEAAAQTLTNYWEEIGTLARSGHLDRRLLWDNRGNTARHWWGVLEPFARATRARLEDPTIAVDFEWLAGEMLSMDRRAGVGVMYDEARLHGAASVDGVRTRREEGGTGAPWVCSVAGTARGCSALTMGFDGPRPR